MFGRAKPEVLVVGAGPVGLFTALCLARRGVAVQIVDAEWRPAAHSYALALHPASLNMLDELGLVGAVLEQAYRVRRVGFFDRAERRVELRLQDLSEDYSFVAVLRQDRLEALLAEALRKEGVKVRWNHRASRFEQNGNAVHLNLDKLVKDSLGYSVAHTEWLVQSSKQLEVPFVIGADGHRSLVRRALEIDFPETGEPQHFAVFEFKTSAEPDNELRVVFNEHDSNVLWPLPDGYCRWSFQLVESKIPDDTRQKNRLAVQIGVDRFPVVEEERLHQLIQERATWFLGSVDEIRWRMAVRFERRLAATFGTGRVWLVGDAGHMNYPVGNQSMNVGLREGRDLAEILTSILKQGAPQDRLEAYGRARRAEWEELMALGGSLRATEVDAWLAGYADRVLPCIPASGSDLKALLGQLGLASPAAARST